MVLETFELHPATDSSFLIMLHSMFIHLLLSYFIFFFIETSFQLFNFLATSCVAFLVKTALHLQFTTQVYSLTLSLICSPVGFK